jgi:hypothetical protein
MATTNEETMYVHNHEELQRTVQNLVQRGGVVQDQSDTEVTLFIKKKMNVVVLIVGLILCVVPGLAYLIWYMTADQSQLMHVKIGKAPNIGGYHPVDETDQSAAAPATAATPPGAPPPAPLPASDPASQIPTMPTAPEPTTSPAMPLPADTVPDPLNPPKLPGGDAETF